MTSLHMIFQFLKKKGHKQPSQAIKESDDPQALTKRFFGYPKKSSIKTFLKMP